MFLGLLTNITVEWAIFYAVIGTVPSQLSLNRPSRLFPSLSTAQVLHLDHRAVQVVLLTSLIPPGGRF